MHKVIKRREGFARIDLAEIWRYRELLAFLVWRDLIVRYKETTIGVLWAFIRPLTMMIIFTWIFGRLAHLPSDGLPYPLLTFAALLPWQLFATTFGGSGTSIAGNAHLISKIYFPRLILPLSATGLALVDFAISLVVLFIMMIWYRVPPQPALAVLPLFVLLCACFALGAGLWSAALDVRYRDVRQAIPFLLQIGFFASPVVFSTSLIPKAVRPFYALNPMVGVIEGFRWALLGKPFEAATLVTAVVVTLLLLVTGAFYFKSSERLFADLL
jgi:lipopolysaccharide transport system permease protein